MTYLELVNEVLKKLRESTVSAVTDTTYSTLIGVWVNDARREVEDAWDWGVLRNELTVTTVAGTSQYTLSSTTERSRILQAINNTRDHVLHPLDSNLFQRWTLLGTQTNANPIYYRTRGWNSSQRLVIDLYPTPDGVYDLRFECIIPQVELVSGNTVLLVPPWPVIQRAYAEAISERGEDGGAAFDETFAMYQKRLGTAIQQDLMRLGNTELNWVVV